MTQMIDAQLHLEAVFGDRFGHCHHTGIVDQNVQSFFLLQESETNGDYGEIAKENRMLCLLGHELPHRIQRGQVQFTIENVVVFRLGDDLLSRNFASLIISARHMNVSTTSSQIQYGFATNSCITSGHNYHLAIDANVAVELTALNPFSVENKTKRKSKIVIS